LGTHQSGRFYYSAPAPCPYLTGRVERRIFTDVSGTAAAQRYEILSEAGFRRSLGFAYRPACPGCNACVPVRIPVADFAPSRSLRRILKRNSDLAIEWAAAAPTAEQFALFARYQGARHGEGDMARMDEQDYRTMIEVGSVDSSLLLARGLDGRLLGVCLTDRMGRGFSAVYSFFDPDQPVRSIGSYLILKLVEECRRTGRDYLYLGFWVPGSRKMAYKSRFRPIEALARDGWRRLDDIDIGAADAAGLPDRLPR
jgi:arginine-tRNA-protein transferase